MLLTAYKCLGLAEESTINSIGMGLFKIFLSKTMDGHILSKRKLQ